MEWSLLDIELKWYDASSYLKYKRSLLGRWNLESNVPIDYDENGNRLFPVLKHPDDHFMEEREFTEQEMKFWNELCLNCGLDIREQSEELNQEQYKQMKKGAAFFQCERCKEQTTLCVNYIKAGKMKMAQRYVGNIRMYKTDNDGMYVYENKQRIRRKDVCTRSCTWYDYFEQQRQNVYLSSNSNSK